MPKKSGAQSKSPAGERVQKIKIQDIQFRLGDAVLVAGDSPDNPFVSPQLACNINE